MSRKPETHQADKFCREVISRLPESLEFAEMFYRDRTILAANRPCPDWCALPASLVASVIAGTNDNQIVLRTLEQTFTGELTAALIWSRNKMIYRFDSTLADTLAPQSLEGEIPPEILNFLPYPCVFVEREITIGWYRTIGFFAWLDWGTKENKKLLRLQFLLPNGKSMGIIIPISGGTIQDSILELANTRDSGAKKDKDFTYEDVRQSSVSKSIIECMNLLLYLCSENPDIPDDTELQTRRSRETNGNPKRAAAWEVGLRIGAVLRKPPTPEVENKESEDDTDTAGKPLYSSPRPHLRRAHWHSFWTGRRNSAERKLVLRWLPPVAVNADGKELPAVINPVKNY